MSKHQPIYELFIDARGCFYEVLINDIPVYFHYNIGATAFRLPINNFIPKTGIQDISLRMISVKEGSSFLQGTEVTLNIDEYPKGFPMERKSIFNYKTSPFGQENKGIFIYENKFSVNIPYELINWQNSIDLSKENKDELKNKLGVIYLEYTNALKNKDLSKYKELIKHRQNNIFTSMYYTEDNIKQEESFYIDNLGNEKIKFHPIENYQLIFYGKGKLVGLKLLKESPGIFIDNEDEENAFIEYIMFYQKDKNNLLEIII